MNVLRCLIFTLMILSGRYTNLVAGNFNIQGNLKGADKEWIYLEYQDDENKELTDSAFVLHGRFTFNGHIETPTFGILYFPVSHIQGNFFFEPGLTSVTGDTSKKSRLTFKGGSCTTLYNEYHLTADSFNQYRNSLTLFISGDKAIKDSTIHAQYMDDFYLSMHDEENWTEQFIRKHPDSYLSAYLLSYKFSGESNINKGIALLSILSPQIQNSKYAKQLRQRQAAFMQSATGMPAPGFSEPDTSGKMIKLSEIKAQYILLDFWASWCGPCRRENPGLVQAYQKFHQKGFEILSVSFDQKKQPWLNAINKDGLTWLNVCSFKGWDDEAAQLYGVSGIPTNFLIDKNGMVVAKNLMGSGLDYELERLLREK